MKKSLFMHKFNMNLFYFILLGVFVCMGYMLISGRIISENPIFLDIYYKSHTWMKIVNIGFGIIFYVLAAALILSRIIFLENFKEAPLLFNVVLISSSFLILLYQILIRKMNGIRVTGVIIELCFFVAICSANISFYKKHSNEI